VNKVQSLKTGVKGLLLIFLIAFGLFFAIWPMPWFHLEEVFDYNFGMRVANVPYSVPEVFFGRLMLVPKIYFAVYFLITTPALIILLFILGLISVSKENKVKFRLKIQKIKISTKNIVHFIKKILIGFVLLQDAQHLQKNLNFNKFILLAVVIWFAFPFVQSLYNFRQHGIRYIIEIYAPLSLLAAIGLDFVLRSAKGKIPEVLAKLNNVRVISVIILVSYLLWINLRISPYYLDYFNELVGGPGTVYKEKFFQMGWWGQGIREGSLWVDNNAKKGSTLGLAVIPLDSVPPLSNVKASEYDDKKEYDYVITSYYNVLRVGFDDSKIRKVYKPIYYVDADGAHLVTVYKKL
jgi:hypothetical protein